MNLDDFLLKEFAGNKNIEYLYVLGFLCVLWVGFYFFQKIVITRLKKASKKTQTDVDDFILNIVQNIKPPFYFFVSIYIASNTLDFIPIVNRVIYGVFIIVVVIQVILIIQKTIDYVLNKKFKSGNGDEGGEHMMRLLGKFSKWALWIIGALLIMSNLGINISSLVAGFGIGGIAIALAAQNVLGDIFASFSIYIDKPFEIGDLIKVGKNTGTVVKIGIKTTRIRTVSGDEMVIPNKKLTDAEIQNMKKRDGRRIIFTIGVTYETSYEKLKEVKNVIKNIFNEYEKEVKLERVHFKELADSSLNFEVVIWLDDPDYMKYLDLRDKVNYAIIEKFGEKKISIAYPTQTIFMGK